MKKHPHIFLAVGAAVHAACLICNSFSASLYHIAPELSVLWTALYIVSFVYNTTGIAIAVISIIKYLKKQSNPLALLSVIYYAIPVGATILSLPVSIIAAGGLGDMPGILIRFTQSCACCAALLGALGIYKSCKKFNSEKNEV